MSDWRAKYPNDYGEYEIIFASPERDETKAVEKVCQAVVDGRVKTPDDIEIVQHGRWIIEGTEYRDQDVSCSVCGDVRHTYGWARHSLEKDVKQHRRCHCCGAKMDL